MSLAYTAIADIIDPEVLADQTSAKFPDFLVIGGSGLVEVNTTFPLGSPGTEFKMPFWKRISDYADLTEGTAMTPGKMGTGSEYATVLRGGTAVEIYDTAQLVSMSDPVGELAKQLAVQAARYVDSKCVVELGKTPNTYDYSGVSAGTMTQDAIITGLINTLGDNYGQMIAGGEIIMHSKVYGDLLKLGAIQNQYQSGMNVLQTGLMPTLLGMPIRLSDRVTTSTVSTTKYYQTFIVGPGSLALFYQRNLQVEHFRDILLKADVFSSDVHFAPHLFGYDDKTSAVAAEDNKSIHVVNIKSK